MSRATRIGPVAAFATGMVVAGVAVGAMVSGPTTRNSLDHYELAGAFLGVGLTIAVLGILRLRTPDSEVRLLHPTLPLGGFGLLMLCVVAVARPWERSCITTSESIVQPGGSVATGSSSTSCATLFRPAAMIPLLLLLGLVAVWGAGRRSVRRARETKHAQEPAPSF